jgi:hypothetical protein
VQIRLESGLDWVEEWSASAGQAQQNALYKALFAIADGSVFHAYLTIGDLDQADEFFVLVRDELVLKVRLHYPDSFDVVFIGSIREAPGRGLDIDLAG